MIVEQIDHPLMALAHYAAVFSEASTMLEIAATFDAERDIQTPEGIEALRALILGARERYIDAGQAILTLVTPEGRPQ